MSALTSVSGFPRIGQNRELKKIIEAYWKGAAALDDVRATAKELRAKHWKLQQAAGIDQAISSGEMLVSCIMEAMYLSTPLSTSTCLNAPPPPMINSIIAMILMEETSVSLI